jgi:hypothetical protein
MPVLITNHILLTPLYLHVPDAHNTHQSEIHQLLLPLQPQIQNSSRYSTRKRN